MAARPADGVRVAAAAPRTVPAAAAARASVPVPSSEIVPVATLPAESADEPVVAPSPTSIAPSPAAAGLARGFWVQLGAFRESAGAESFARRIGAEVEGLAPLLATVGDAALYRVQAGPYGSRDEAQGAATRMREALGLVPVIVERR